MNELKLNDATGAVMLLTKQMLSETGFLGTQATIEPTPNYIKMGYT